MSFLVVAVSTLNYGFDNNGYTTTQAMDPFIRQFGKVDPMTGKHELPTSWLSMFNSLNFIGYAFGQLLSYASPPRAESTLLTRLGVVLGSMVSERYGRRWCMFAMSGHALVCAAIAVTSSTPEQIMTARVLNCGSLLTSIPV